MKEEYFEELIALANKALLKDEVPVSALIVCNNKVISKAYNTKNKLNLVFNHAEVLAIKKASKKLKTWHLNDCDLYVTLKPCSICEAIIKQSQIKNVYYLLDKPNEKKEYYKTNISKANIRTLEMEYSQQLKGFFQKKRDKKKTIWYN